MTGQRKYRTWPVLVLVWATFVLFGLVAAPVPGVNEPHYLCKAKHFWQPEWCAQDFFLTSPNAHTVFYATVGCLTKFVSFEQSAWIGRIVAMFVVAWGWTRSFSRLFFTRWAPLWCAWVFLFLTACGNFSGEWLIGGVEGKVFCYGLLLAAFGDVIRHRYLHAAAWAGLAISFHPVAGLWGVLAFAIPASIRFLKTRCRSSAPSTIPGQHTDESHRVDSAVNQTGRQWSHLTRWLSVPIIVVLALPGLIPVIQLLMEPASAKTRVAATFIQVYYRLPHHLDPMTFQVTAYWGYTAMLVVWCSSFWWSARTNAKRMFDGIVLWAVLFAMAGIVIGYDPRPAKTLPSIGWRMQLLKFYPFRLADILVPIALSVSLIGVLERTFLNTASHSGIFKVNLPRFVMVLVLITALWRAGAVSETNRYSREDRADWLNVCHWIDVNLPPDALVQSPKNGWAFKWFARRAEYVAFKDCPQDAVGIVEWNRRLNFLNKWYEQKYRDGFYSASELRELSESTGITHVLTDRLGPMELEPIFRNATFQVYDLRESGR